MNLLFTKPSDHQAEDLAPEDTPVVAVDGVPATIAVAEAAGKCDERAQHTPAAARSRTWRRIRTRTSQWHHRSTRSVDWSLS